ncbi:hypothetical protein BV898_03057 [Hypsibius exemplaris]|uniref:G-protein coupled receptors family 1 profile domain-containing protein n=1 Tax=Hypsibius exemplaris TaxID=2072580 RepID=A0A1W0X5Y0_HYPEX|nr:hypothetical protein BV898_03057 [Hypsibius exemplaris]
MNVLSWMIALVTNLLLALDNMAYHLVDNRSNGGCTFLLTGKGPNVPLANTIVGIYIPTAVIGISYAMFLLKTCRHHSGPQSGSRICRRRLELSRTMLILFMWHCASLSRQF